MGTGRLPTNALVVWITNVAVLSASNLHCLPFAKSNSFEKFFTSNSIKLSMFISSVSEHPWKSLITSLARLQKESPQCKANPQKELTLHYSPENMAASLEKRSRILEVLRTLFPSLSNLPEGREGKFTEMPYWRSPGTTTYYPPVRHDASSESPKWWFFFLGLIILVVALALQSIMIDMYLKGHPSDLERSRFFLFVSSSGKTKKEINHSSVQVTPHSLYPNLSL